MPWGTISDMAIKHHVLIDKQLPDRPRNVLDSEWEIITRMCCFNPKDRINASALVHLIRTFWSECA